MKRWIALLCAVALLLCALTLVGCKDPDELPEGEPPASETPGDTAPAAPEGPKGEKDPAVSDNFQ